MYPSRMTFEYLWRTIPELETAEEFEDLVRELRRRWHFQPTGPKKWWEVEQNFRGMLEAGLRPDVKREVVRRRNARVHEALAPR